MTQPTMTRTEAKAAGLPRYFTGKLCKHGHVSERRTTSGTCVKCESRLSAANTKRHPETALAWRKANPEKVKAWGNPEKRKATTEAWRAQNQEKIKATSRAYRKNHLDASAHKSRKRRAIKKAAEGSHTLKDIQHIHTLQKGKCACCKRKVGKKYHVDHIHPLTKGGSNWPSNLQILCPACNMSKSNKDPIEHRQSLGMLL